MMLQVKCLQAYADGCISDYRRLMDGTVAEKIGRWQSLPSSTVKIGEIDFDMHLLRNVGNSLETLSLEI